MIQALKGKARVAPDKSLSHRALLFAAIAEGESIIRNVLTGEDVLRTLKILNQLGVQTQPLADEIFSNPTAFSSKPLEVRVKGVGLHGFKSTKEILYCGNSGTTMRLLLGLLSAQSFSSRLTGDASLNRRPMDRVIEPLEKAGAKFVVHQTPKGRVIECVGRSTSQPVMAVAHVSKVASAQVKTCLLLSGLYSQTATTITEPALSRNHTELLFAHMGASLKTTRHEDAITIEMRPVQKLKPLDFTVPADISSAAFFLVAASLIPNSDITLESVNINPTRTGILDVLKNMDANLQISNVQNHCGEEVADIRVKAASLKGVEVSNSLIPRLIDEIPILALAGFAARGHFEVSDAKELKVKESDRIHAIVINLIKCNANIKEKPDGFVIEGVGFQGITVGKISEPLQWQTFGDHRIAMMGVVANLVLGTQFEIDNIECIRTSFPSFFEVIANLQR